MDAHSSTWQLALSQMTAAGLRLQIAVLLLVIAVLVLVAFLEPAIEFLCRVWMGAIRQCAKGFSVMRVKMKTDPLAHWIAACIIALVTISIRAYFLFQPIRYDEAFTFLTYASQPWYLAISNYSTPNNHILHTLLVHFTCLAFGGKVWALRMPAFISGVLIVPATYLLCRLLSGRNAAIFAAALSATSSVLTEFSVNARGYASITLATLLLALTGWLCLAEYDLSLWLIFVVIGALGFATVPTMLFSWLTVLLWLIMNASLARGRSSRAFLGECLYVTLLTMTLTGVLYIPAFVGSGYHALVANPFLHSLPLKTFIPGLLNLPRDMWWRWKAGLPSPLWVLLLFATLCSLLMWRRITRERIPIYLALFVAVIMLSCMQRVVPYPRSLLFVFAIVAIYAGAGLAFALSPFGSSSWLVPAIATVLCLALATKLVMAQSVYYSEDTGTFRDVDVVFGFLTRTMKVEDVLLAVPPCDAPLQFYASGQEYRLQSGVPGSGRPVRVFAVLNKRMQTTHADGVTDKRILSLEGVKELCGITPYSERSALQTPFSMVYEIYGTVAPVSNLCQLFYVRHAH